MALRPCTTFKKDSERLPLALSWTTGLEPFDGFEEVLLDTALMHWEDLVTLIAEADKTTK
jgi:hypothetical protein